MKSLKTKDIIIFTKKFLSLLKTKSSLLTCLDLLWQQETNQKLKEILKSIKKQIEKGNSLSYAFKKHEATFGLFYVGMIEAGEETGKIAESCAALLKHLERQEKFQQKTKNAISYPLFSFITALIIAFLTLSFVLPNFIKIFETFSNTLPLPTKALLFLSSYIKNNFFYILIITILLIFIFRALIKEKKIKTFLDAFFFKIPFVGAFVKKLLIARFCEALSLMLKNNIDLMKAIAIASDLATNTKFEKITKELSHDILQGYSLSFSLEAKNFFPDMMWQMIKIGEASANMALSLEEVANVYNDEIEFTLDNFTKMIEPILMVFVALVLGILILAIYLPIFKMAGGIM